MRLLLIRPDPDAQRTASVLRARGHDVMVSPLLSIETIANADLGTGPYAAVLMTSANAARAIATHPQLRDLVALAVFAVGNRTAEAARNAGFAKVRSAQGDAADLVMLVRKELPGGDVPVLYLAGEDRARDIAAALAGVGPPVRIAVVYRAEMARRFPAAVQSALAAQTLDGVLHFSRRSAEAYVRCAHAAQGLDQALRPVHFCLSAEVAAPLGEGGAQKIRVAHRPDEAAMLDLVDQG